MITSEDVKFLNNVLSSSDPISTDERLNKRFIHLLYKLDLGEAQHFTIDSWALLKLVAFP